MAELAPESRPNLRLLWDFMNPLASRQSFEDLRQNPEYTSDPAYLAEIETQIARTWGLERQFNRAHAILDAIPSSTLNAHPAAQIRTLLERGRLFNSNSESDQALPLFLEAWEMATAHGEDFLAVDAAHMVAIANPEQALEWNTRALEQAQASDDPLTRIWRGSLLNNLGWTFHDQGKFETAQKHFESALSARLEEGEPSQIRIARWCVGRVLRSLGRIDEALDLQTRLLEESQDAGTDAGYTLEEVAECLLVLDRAPEAAPYFARAYAILSQDPWLARREPERLLRLKQRSKINAAS